MRAANALLVSAVVLLVGCARPAPPFENPTLCQLAEHREAYEGHSVTAEGELLVGRHGSVVSDPRCGYGVGIGWRESDIAALPELDRIAGLAMDEPIRARVRVRGVMQQDEHENMAGIRGWTIRVSQGEVIAAVRLSDRDWSRYLSWYEGPSSAPFRPIQPPVPVRVSETPGSAR